MPRKSKGARLHLKSARHDGSGNVTHRATWIIRDNGRDVSTGCAEDEIADAEKALQNYIASKHRPKRKAQDIEVIPLGDVLSIYLDAELAELRERLKVEEADEDTIPAIRKFKKRIERLNDFGGAKMLADVDGDFSRDYAKERGNRGGARRDLEDLRAAINHHASEGYHHGLVKVKLPGKGEARDRWLTRSEAAALIWACWRHREVQTHSGRKVATEKRPLRHIARFILIGLYSGSRAGAIAAASPIPAIGRAFVDLERGVYHRRAKGKAKTNKRAPSVKIAPRLLTHLRRWHRLGIARSHFVEWNGKPVKSVKTGFKTAVGLARLSLDEGNVSPHTLRHTAATWLMQLGTDPWQASGYLGMSLKTLMDTYGHHHPDHMADAVEKIAQRPGKAGQKKDVSGAVTGAVVKFEQPKK